jgi:hypothetical protein
MSDNVIKIIPNELDGNSRYSIRVRSVNSFGVTSDWSEVLIIDTDDASSSTGGRLALTSNGMIAYDANGQTSFVYSGESAGSRTNLVVNPSFEINTNGWTSVQSSISRITTDFYVGETSYKASLKITANAASSNVGVITALGDRIPVSTGQIYSASAYVKAIASQVSLKIGLSFYNSVGTLIKTVYSLSPREVLADGLWTRISSLGTTTPNNATSMGVTIVSSSVMANSQSYLVDGVLVELSSTLGDYFDGSTSIGATKWSGTAHYSTSTFDLTSPYFVDGGVFTAGTLQTAVDVGVGSPFGKAGVKMSVSGIQGYSGLQATPSFSLDTAGKFRVGGLNNYIYWDGNTLTVAGNVAAGTIDIGGFDNTSFHVDASGQVWSGSGSFSTAPLKIYSTGVLRATATNGYIDISGGVINISSEVDWGTANAYLNFSLTDPNNQSGFIKSDGGLYISSASAWIQMTPTDSANAGAISMGIGSTKLFLSSSSYPNLDNFDPNRIYGWLDIPVISAATPGFTTNGTVGIGNVPVDGTILTVYEARSSVNATIHLTHVDSGYTINDGLSMILSSAGVGYLRLRENNDLRLGTNNVDRFYITSTGELRANADGSTSSPILSFVNDTNTGIYRRGTDDIAITAGGADKIVCNGTATYITLAANGGETTSVRYDGFGGLHFQSSNRDLKDNIQDLSNKTALKLITELKPKTFTWKPLSTDSSLVASLRPLYPHIGFIAEEVAEIGKSDGFDLAEWKIPSNPEDIEDLSKWQVSYWKESQVITLLVGAIQELNDKIKNLES